MVLCATPDRTGSPGHSVVRRGPSRTWGVTPPPVGSLRRRAVRGRNPCPHRRACGARGPQLRWGSDRRGSNAVLLERLASRVPRCLRARHRRGTRSVRPDVAPHRQPAGRCDPSERGRRHFHRRSLDARHCVLRPMPSGNGRSRSTAPVAPTVLHIHAAGHRRTMALDPIHVCGMSPRRCRAVRAPRGHGATLHPQRGVRYRSFSVRLHAVGDRRTARADCSSVIIERGM